MSAPAATTTREWLRLLPKCELHIHLEGTIQSQTLVELSKRHDSAPLSLEQAQQLYKYDDFLGFLTAFGQVTQRLRSADDYELITYDAIAALAGQGVRHAEMYISFGQILRSSFLSVELAMAAAERGRIRAEQQFGTTILWIVDIIRQRGVQEASLVLHKALEMREVYSAVVGIGIGGNEEAGPVAGFKELFAEAKLAGLRVKAHAGEAQPASSIWNALDAGVERIGHGLTAAEDQELMRTLAELQIPMEICVTSNVATGCCKSVEEHPIQKFHEAGLNITLNSDDPPMFGTTLLEEFVIVMERLNFTEEDMVSFARNSIMSSFLSEEGKGSLVEMLDEFTTTTARDR